jgi:staphylococcal nuclease domain-containing protein 1
VDHTDRDGTLYVTLYDANKEPTAGESINAEVVSEGLAMVPRKLKPWERAFNDVLEILSERERIAKDEERRGMWEYGDLTED